MKNDFARGLLALLFACVIGATIATMIPAPQFVREIPAKELAGWEARWASSAPGRSYATVAYTGSMEPALHGGDVLLLAPFEPPARVGEILCYQNIVHRVTAANPRAAYFSGDANRWSDGWIKNEVIQWRVVQVLRVR